MKASATNSVFMTRRAPPQKPCAAFSSQLEFVFTLAAAVESQPRSFCSEFAMLLSAVTREELLQHLHRAPTSFATDEATGQLTTALHNPNEVVRAELAREASAPLLLPRVTAGIVAHHRRELRQTRAVAADTTELVLTRSYGKSPEKIRRDAARRAAQAQAAAQAERLRATQPARHGALGGRRRAREAARGGGASERRASRAVLAAAVEPEPPAAARAEAARARARRADGRELRARVQDYPMDDDGSPRRRGSRMRPSESAPALGRFRAPS